MSRMVLMNRMSFVACFVATLWAQPAFAQHAGHGGTAQSEPRVEKPRQDPHLSMSPGPHQVDVRITEAGFSPKEIPAGAGDSVTLYITRVTEATCKEINFFGRGVQVALPIGQTVKITIDVNEPGLVRFGCLSGDDGAVIKVAEARR